MAIRGLLKCVLYEASSDDGVRNMASQGVIYLFIYFPNGKLTPVSCNCWEALCVPDVSGELKDFHFLLVPNTPFKESSQPVPPLLTGANICVVQTLGRSVVGGCENTWQEVPPNNERT